MSRSGYIDDCEDNLAIGRWRGAVLKSIEGKRGQSMLKELLVALDEMQDKKLYPNSFQTQDGEFCALGVLGYKRGTKMDDLVEEYFEDDPYCDIGLVAERFGVSKALVSEIMDLNDESLVDDYKYVDVEICGPVRPWYPEYGRHSRRVSVLNENHAQERWQKMRDWVSERIINN